MKTPSSLTALLFLLILQVSLAKAELIDAGAAVVNEDVITLSEVEEAGRAVFAKIAQEVPPDRQAGARQEARQAVLEQLIEKRLLLQQAAKMKIAVTEAEIDQARDQLIQRGGGDMEAFRAELKKAGLTEQQHREELREELLASKLISYAVRSKVVVSEEKIKEYYDRNDAWKTKPGGRHLLQIGFHAEKQNRTEVRTKAETVRKLAAEGQDFGQLVKQHSELPSAADGGDIGTFQEEEMAASMRKAVMPLKPGEISPVVETPDGFMIFKLLSSGQESGDKAPFASVKEEIRGLLHKQEMERRYKAWMEEIRSGAYIRIL